MKEIKQKEKIDQVNKRKSGLRNSREKVLKNWQRESTEKCGKLEKESRSEIERVDCESGERKLVTK